MNKRPVRPTILQDGIAAEEKPTGSNNSNLPTLLSAIYDDKHERALITPIGFGLWIFYAVSGIG